eukprot:gene3452-5407_t
MEHIPQVVDPRKAANFDSMPATHFIDERVVEGRIIDVSSLAPADRKIFLFSLFEKDFRSYHVLDCTATTPPPPEDVKAFLSLYEQTTTGRLVVFGLQALQSDSQNDVRYAIEQDELADCAAGKELVAIITEGSASDETIAVLNRRNCGVKWKKRATEACVKLSRFESIEQYTQPPGTGKTYTIEHKIATNAWGEDAVVARLDLDATKTSINDVCTRVMGPMANQRGLLYVHVSHDASVSMVNHVLDHLVFMGRLESESGLAVHVQDNWHLVVEFQQPPPPEQGHRVNNQWKLPDGSSDVTLLACHGLTVQGVLLEYQMKERLTYCLRFIRRCRTYRRFEMPDNDLTLAHMLLNGVPHLQDKTAAAMAVQLNGTCTHRQLTRALELITKRYLLHDDSALVNKQMFENKSVPSGEDELVCMCLESDVKQYIHPDIDSHFHLIISSWKFLQLHGQAQESVVEAVTAYQVSKFERWLLMKKDDAPSGEKPTCDTVRRLLQATNDEPLYRLIEFLSSELQVHPKEATSILQSKNYVLTSDFLRKLIQLNGHMSVRDPVILQGPSGTGKSYAINILSVLHCLPSPTPEVGHGRIPNIERVLRSWIKGDPSWKLLFPDSRPDVEDIVFNAGMVSVCSPTNNCLEVLKKKKQLEALEYVREAVKDMLGPLFSMSVDPEIVKAKQDDKAFAAAIKVLNEGPDQRKDRQLQCEEVAEKLRVISNKFKVLSGAFLCAEVLQTIKNAVRSSDVSQLTGSVTAAELHAILDQDLVRDAYVKWVAKACDKVGSANRAAFVLKLKQRIKDLLDKTPVYEVSRDFMAKLSDTTVSDDREAVAAEMCDIMRRLFDMKVRRASVDILMRYDMTPQKLFDQMRPMLEFAH